MSYIIAIANHKGGVGKTTTTVTLAHSLSNRGYKTLVIDLDYQCNSSSRLLTDYEQRKGLYDLLNDVEDDISICIHKSKYAKVNCMPNNLSMSGLELLLIKNWDFFKIKRLLRDYVKKHYDYILLDSPPNMLYFFYSALFIADFCIIPILATSRDGLRGLKNVLDEIAKIQINENPNLKFLRMLINGLDKRYSVHKAIFSEIRDIFNENQIFETIIPTNAKFGQTEYLGKTVIEHDNSCIGARAFRSLSNELLSIIPPDKNNEVN